MLYVTFRTSRGVHTAVSHGAIETPIRDIKKRNAPTGTMDARTHRGVQPQPPPSPLLRVYIPSPLLRVSLCGWRSKYSGGTVPHLREITRAHSTPTFACSDMFPYRTGSALPVSHWGRGHSNKARRTKLFHSFAFRTGVLASWHSINGVVPSWFRTRAC